MLRLAHHRAAAVEGQALATQNGWPPSTQPGAVIIQTKAAFSGSWEFNGKQWIGWGSMRDRQHRHDLTACLAGGGQDDGARPIFYAFFLSARIFDCP